MNTELGKPKGIKTYFGNLWTPLAYACVACSLLTISVGQEKESRKVSLQRAAQTNSNTSQSGGSQSGDRSERSQIEVNKDRFSGATTVKLKPQLILDKPDHQLTMAVEAKLEGKKQIGIFQGDETVRATFTSQSKMGINLGDRELHFLVDGEQVKIGRVGSTTANASSAPAKPELRVGRYLISVMPLDKLRHIAEGRNVEMRLGTIQVTLDAKLLSNLRAFVAASAGASGQ